MPARIEVDVRLGAVIIRSPDTNQHKIFNRNETGTLTVELADTIVQADAPDCEDPDQPWEPLYETRSINAEIPTSLHETNESMWKNNLYTVIRSEWKYPGTIDDPEAPTLVHLSLRRNDRAPVTDWRHKQKIKNELVGEDCEGLELYPAEDRMVDTSNQFHCWVLPAGEEIPVGMRGPKRKPLAERFWPRVDTSGGEDACWPWMGARNPAPHDYGRVARGGESSFQSPFFTHRVAYALSHNIEPDDLPADQEVRHSCHNPPCCNPRHLSLGTSAENKADSIAVSRMHFQNTIRDDHGRFTDQVADGDVLEDEDFVLSVPAPGDGEAMLWCFPPGMRVPVGYEDGRVTCGQPLQARAKQRPFVDGEHESVSPEQLAELAEKYRQAQLAKAEELS